MRKPLSTMTADTFVASIGALGVTQRELGHMLMVELGRKRAYRRQTISKYATGNWAIPQDVADAIARICQNRAHSMQLAADAAKAPVGINALIGKLLVHTNQRKRPAVHPTEGRFMRRQTPVGMDTMLLPAYRLRHQHLAVYATSLKHWSDYVRGLAHHYTDQARQRDYQLELADLKCVVDATPRQAPYDIRITYAQWQVVNRALLHSARRLHNPKANSLRVHWFQHRGSGYPVNR